MRYVRFISLPGSTIIQVVTVSDRASTGVYNDLSGPAILNFFKDAIDSPWSVLCMGMWACGHAMYVQ